VLLAASGRDPYVLIDAVIAAAAAHLKTFRPRSQKTFPPLFENLGWCTWEAMGLIVSERCVLQALASLDRAEIRPRWVLIDDCWGEANEDSALTGFGADPKKFPGELSRLFEKMWKRFGIWDAGVWVTLQGYWTGVSAKGPWQDLRLLRPAHPQKNSKGKSAPASRFVAPGDIAQFFHRWFGTLRQEGVNLVKVDG